MAPRRLSLTGASGGGSVLTCLLTSDKPEITELKISVVTSGTSNLATRGITQQAEESRLFSDRDHDVYEYEKERNATERYEQKDTDLKVIQLGEELGIKTFIVMAPCVYGRGTGFFHQQSHQIPLLARNAIDKGSSEYVGDGSYRLGHVNVVDLASLFHLILSLILNGSEPPYGRRGIYFANTGTHSWLEVAKGLGQAGAKLGALRSSEPSSITLEQVAARLFAGNASRAELTLAANSKTTPDLARSIGWEPQCSEKDWAQGLGDVFQYCYDESRKDP
ncbi:nad dependent epimerase dehydratase family protein [Seiridium cupressi]